MISYGALDPVRAAWRPWRALTILREHRVLIARLVQREVQGRYRDSLLGLFWALANPILILAVYTFVFIFVMQARWPAQVTGGPAVATLYLFSGLIHFRGPRKIVIARQVPRILSRMIPLCSRFDSWPAAGSEDTELGVLLEPEVGHGEAEVYTRVQA